MHNKQETLVTIFVTLTIVIVEVAISFNSALLPNLKDDFKISEQLAQMSVGIGFFALGISGLCYGAISENIGRKPIIIGGMTLFCLGAILSVISQSTTLLMIGRFTQGVGAGAGWIVGNACLKDICSTENYPKIMNKVHAVAGIVPTIAPAIGAYIAGFLGWRITFCFVILAASSLLAVKVLKLPETNFDRGPISFGSIVETYKNLYRNKTYLKYLTVKSLIVMLLFTDSANTPLIFVENLNVNPAYYGLYVLPVSIFYVLGSYVSALLIGKYLIDTLINAGLVLIFISNFLLVIINHFHPLDAIEIQILKTLTHAGWGMIFGNATATLISSAPKNSGAASAVMIAVEMLLSSCGIYILGKFYNGTIVPLSIFMIGTSLFCFILMIKKR